MKSTLMIIAITILDVALVGVGVYGTAESAHASWLSFSVAAVGIVTFFGFLQVDRDEGAGKHVSERVVRRAIAAAAVVVYLVLVSIVAFFSLKGQPLSLENLQSLSPQDKELLLAQAKQQIQNNPVTDMLLTNFTAIIGVIVAFYFGSSAYVEAKKS